MKKPILVLLAALALLVSSPEILAQISSYQTNIYFDSGKDALDSKAIAELEAFAAKIALLEDFEVDVRAYTDDIGTVQYNKALSERRAAAAFNFLLSKKIQPAKQEIVGAGILPTDKKNSKKATKEELAEVRSRNRRVDVRVIIFAPKTIDEVQNYFGQRDKNTCLFSGQKDTAIQGQKGTILFVAANSFEQKDGKAPALPIKIELREAYTFADMILQNLTTVSNGQLLQTGGMVHISATDANGQELQLAAGKKIDIAMPLKGELPKGMQLFTADRPAADNGTGINWIAQADTFIVFPSSPKLNKIPRGLSTATKELALEGTAFPFPIRPIYKTAFIAPVSPKLQLIKTAAPNAAEIKAKNPKQRGENAKNYEARLAKIYSDRQETHEKYSKTNARRQEEFAANTAKYSQDSATYANNINLAQAYTDSIERAIAYIFIHSQAYNVTAHINKQVTNLTALYLQLKNIDDLRNHATMLGFDSLAQEFTKLYEKGAANVGSVNKLKAVRADLISQTNKDFFSKQRISYFAEMPIFNIQKNTHNSLLVQKIDAYANSLRYCYERSSSLENRSFESYCEYIYKNIGEALYSGEFLALAESCQDKMLDFDLNKKIEAGALLSEEVAATHKKLMELKAEAGLLSVEEGNVLARTMVSSANLGWINCDRFLDYKREDCDKAMFAMQDEPNANISFYAIVPEINAITQFSKTGTGFQLPYNGIPKNMIVKLLGLRIAGGKFFICSYEVKAEEIKNINIKFEPCKLSDINKALANL